MSKWVSRRLFLVVFGTVILGLIARYPEYEKAILGVSSFITSAILGISIEDAIKALKDK